MIYEINNRNLISWSVHNVNIISSSKPHVVQMCVHLEMTDGK